MANFDSRMDCNTFWILYGASKNVTKYGPSEPVFITNYFKKYKTKYGNIHEHIIFISENIFLKNRGRPMYLAFWNFGICNLTLWKLENIKTQFGHSKIRNIFGIFLLLEVQEARDGFTPSSKRQPGITLVNTANPHLGPLLASWTPPRCNVGIVRCTLQLV